MVTASSDEFDTVIKLWSPAGEILADDDDGGIGTNSQLETTLPADGRYRVSVDAFTWGFDNPSGIYEVAVRVVESTPNPGSERTARRRGDRVGDSSLRGRDLLQYVPPEVTGVEFVDVDALMNSDIYQWLAHSPLLRTTLQEMQVEAGLDLEDVDHLITGVDVDGGRAIVVLAGRFDQTTLEALAQQNGGVEARHGDRRWFRFDDDTAIAMLEPGVIAVGAQPFVMRALVPPADAGSIESNGRPMHLLRYVPADSTVWGVGRFDNSELGLADLAFGARLDDGVHGTFTIEMPDDLSAERLRTQIEMLQAVVSSNAPSQVEQDLIDSFQVTAADNMVTLSFALSNDLLREILTAIELVAWPDHIRVASALLTSNRRHDRAS